MALKTYKSPDQTLMLLQNQWTAQLNPLLANQLTQGSFLPNISLVSGATTFNHYLGKQMTGWFIVDIDAASTIYRSAPLNSQTLTLTSANPVIVALWVF